MKSYSQARQDIFAFLLCDNKKTGFYVDIGSYNGIDLSNTFLLEQLGWKGLLVEGNASFAEMCKQSRKENTVCCLVGLQSDPKNNILSLEDLFEEYEVPKHIDYLSIDIENNPSSTEVMETFPFDHGYDFTFLTLETNRYVESTSDSRVSCRKILERKGYSLLAEVTDLGGYVFEDWFLNSKSMDIYLPTYEEISKVVVSLPSEAKS